ncbi:hypothetical protein [Salinarimonas soli]|uniref:Uncharacterized protein n=1 Tax=Salinarimonas soli TaxID=1638099 RepID=A0A5B2V934_9HYPH|nr:hypothetical protein [Salinarimonas soli]KAA2234849.1 hypothetical protein F0L46_22390 [Salinarimonas soli]
MAPLIPPRRLTPSRSALPFVLLRTVLLVLAVVGMDIATGGTIRRNLSDGADGSLASVADRAVMSARGSFDGFMRRNFTR